MKLEAEKVCLCTHSEEAVCVIELLHDTLENKLFGDLMSSEIRMIYTFVKSVELLWGMLKETLFWEVTEKREKPGFIAFQVGRERESNVSRAFAFLITYFVEPLGTFQLRLRWFCPTLLFQCMYTIITFLGITIIFIRKTCEIKHSNEPFRFHFLYSTLE